LHQPCGVLFGGTLDFRAGGRRRCFGQDHTAGRQGKVWRRGSPAAGKAQAASW
jgi:hypothetical protein